MCVPANERAITACIHVGCGQDRAIAALLADYREMKAHEDARAKDLTSNISEVQGSLNAGVAALDKLRDSDKDQVLCTA